MSGIMQILAVNGINPYLADPLFSNVVLFCNLNGAELSEVFTDVKGHTQLAGGAGLATGESKFGGASAYFNGFWSYKTFDHADFDLGTGDWSVDFWARPRAVTGDLGIFQIAASLLPGTYAPLSVFLNSAGVGLYHNGGSSIGSTVLSVDTWYHFEITRYGGTVTLYLNGIAETTRSAATMAGNQVLTMGAAYSTTYYYYGYIDNFRITKGVARHTANFTPPTTEFT